ncbi:Crp/Fnr family transcriptional regulator [Sphingobacterium deserti]|uniref:Cyclic nucleotide-binding protein n=1 Tax=Sphingobacterium deserti TaxID=1229276 RepID=A0A0B8TB42_9SPHI|nr:Crp/Fnr family transcriptional regulator [Sphingobacterium deserti]KGE15355.1 cyclic nucleotide-binding protein [Sphingobacterium deserti]
MDALAIIQRIAPLNKKDLALLLPLFEEIVFKKSTAVIEAEKKSRYLYFIRSGACRVFYHKEEREVILDFAFPGDALISLNSYVHDKAGYETIQTMETSTLYKIDSLLLKALFSQSIGIANWGRRLAEIETLKIEYRLMSKLFKTATQSYEELLERSPEVVRTIKLGFIASYLGISQVTLSRIRAKGVLPERFK